MGAKILARALARAHPRRPPPAPTPVEKFSFRLPLTPPPPLRYRPRTRHHPAHLHSPLSPPLLVSLHTAGRPSRGRRTPPPRPPPSFLRPRTIDRSVASARPNVLARQQPTSLAPLEVLQERIETHVLAPPSASRRCHRPRLPGDRAFRALSQRNFHSDTSTSFSRSFSLPTQRTPSPFYFPFKYSARSAFFPFSRLPLRPCLPPFQFSRCRLRPLALCASTPYGLSLDRSTVCLGL